MDNLAHSLTGALVGTALLPRFAVLQKKRLLLTSALLANLPDVDVLLALLGKKFYFFHHRGFTHSLLGLLVTVPLGLLIFYLLLEKKQAKQSHIAAELKVSTLQKVFFVLVQLLFSHFYLDYLTTYGTMFLYPWQWTRFSFPLMFIVDPILWLITGLGCLALWRKDLGSSKEALRIAWLSLAGVFGLWGVELGFKLKAEARFAQVQAAEQTHVPKISSFPGPLAPMIWLLLAENGKDAKGPRFHQAGLSFRPQEVAIQLRQEPIPSGFVQDGFCTEGAYPPSAFEDFASFKRWGEYVVCSPFEYEGRPGCRCASLKYSLASTDAMAFGAFWVPEDGREALFLAPDGWSKLQKYYELYESKP